MWTVIYMILSESKANNIKEQLALDGFLVKTQSINKDNRNDCFQILVPESEAEEAYNRIIELGLS